MNYSKGITWFDDCRIPFVEADSNINFDRPRLREKKDWVYDLGTKWEDPNVKEYNTQGRFPANLLCSDDVLNDGNIIQYNKNRKDNGTYLGGHREVYVGEGEIKKKVKGDFYSDKGSNSRYYDIDKWFEKMLNEL